MELEELIPGRIEWTPSVEGQTFEFFFRPFSIEDESWLKRTYPDGRLEKVFAEVNTIEIARIAYHQLEIDSKRKLMSITFKDLDEEGQEIEIAKTGPEKIGVMVRGPKETMDLIDKILQTRGLSLPLLEKIVEKVGIDGLKKMSHGKA